MARSDPQLNFRIPSELRDKLDAAAKGNNRSLTGELIARLEASFDTAVHALPFAAEEAIEFEQEERGGTRIEALTRLVLTGLANGGTVVNISIAPGTTMAHVREMIDGASQLLPADAPLFVERQDLKR